MSIASQCQRFFVLPIRASSSDGVVLVDGVSFGASSYGPNALVSALNNFTTNPPTSTPQGRARIPNDFADGTSHTILHAEKYARCTNTDMAPAFQDGGTAWAYCTAPLFPWQPPPMTLPGKAFQPGFAIAALATRGAPNAIGPGSIFQVQPIPGNCDPTRAATAHTGGMVVGLADGSVRTSGRGYERRRLVGRRDARGRRSAEFGLVRKSADKSACESHATQPPFSARQSNSSRFAGHGTRAIQAI